MVVAHNTVLTPLPITKTYYVIREETTYTYDRDNNDDDDESAHFPESLRRAARDP